MAAFGLTIFLSAFLLFSVQPLMGRYLLPWFGGTPAVWTACMLFFQVFLLGGYAYAHWLTRSRPPRQNQLHLVLLAASAVLLPAIPSPDRFSVAGGIFPPLQIWLTLVATIGLPFFLLSATAPLLQYRFSRCFPGRSPYRLYALSNGGSLLALLSYPLLMEPTLTLARQSLVWSWGYGLYGVGCAFCLLHGSLRAKEPAGNAQNAATPEPAGETLGAGIISLWLVLPALGSAMLLAVTNQLCQEVASVPFLWVFPLALYLLSFILTFESERWYRRWLWGGVFAVLAPIGWWAFYAGPRVPLVGQLVLYPLLLFVCCMLCHGELYQLRPQSSYHLTRFYLCLSLGGALGGLFVNLAAPLLFNTFFEYVIVLIATCSATLVIWTWQRAWRFSLRQPLFWVVLVLAGCVLLFPVVQGRHFRKNEQGVLERSRNFYGTLTVSTGARQNGAVRTLVNGHIMHGSQYQDGELRTRPTSYYADGSPVQLLFKLANQGLEENASGTSLTVGVIGTGVGTLAAFGKSGDRFRFYEINPRVIDVAQRYFSFLEDSRAEVEIVIDDGRIALEKEFLSQGSHRFHILVADAFTSDAIPLHLVTEESFRTYLNHLHPDGFLLFNVTNRFVDLCPVIRGLAEKTGYRALRLTAAKDEAKGRDSSRWVVVSRNPRLLQNIRRAPLYVPWGDQDPPPIVFTDDFSSLLKIMKLRPVRS